MRADVGDSVADRYAIDPGCGDSAPTSAARPAKCDGMSHTGNRVGSRVSSCSAHSLRAAASAPVVVSGFEFFLAHDAAVMSERVLMVCVGNICRSPIGEALWNHRLKQLGLPGTAASAGISARLGDPIHPVSAQLLQARGVPVEGQGSRPLRTAMLREADLVLVMEYWHKSTIERMAPFTRGRVYLLGHWQGFEIPDPMGEPESAFKSAFERIDRGVCGWLERLKIVGS